MSSPRSDTTEPETSEKSASSVISPVQIAAGALAAVSSAVVMSFFGVAGTLIGAALASIISSVSAALYSESLRKTNERLRQARELRGGPRSAVPVGGNEQPATTALPAHLDPRKAAAPRGRPRWARLTGFAVAVFVLAMGIVTGIEVIGDEPVSALVGGTSNTSESTTLQSVTDGISSRDTTPSTPSTPSPASPGSETPDPSETPSTDDDTDTDTDTAESTTAPSTSTPRSTGEAEKTTQAPETSQAPKATQAPRTTQAPEPSQQQEPAAEPTS